VRGEKGRREGGREGEWVRRMIQSEDEGHEEISSENTASLNPFLLISRQDKKISKRNVPPTASL